MASRRPTMMDPPIEALLDKVDSRFALVTVSARRARQINSYFNQLGEGLGAIVPPQVASVSRKPLSIALEEIVSEKITFTAIPDDEQEPGQEAVAQLGVAEESSAGEAAAGEATVPEPVSGEPSGEGPH